MSKRLFPALFAAVLFCVCEPAAAECLKAEAEGQHAEGRLERVTFTDIDYGNQVEVAFILNLAKAACLDGEDEYDKIESTLKIHVFSMDKAIDQRLRVSIGRQIRVVGWPFGEHTRHRHAPIVMRVTEVMALP